MLRIKYGLFVPRQEVQSPIRMIDPAGVEERKCHRVKRRKYESPGPSYCWHVDGYDKLKPFGFPIHGAVDGYSRMVMWLKVDRTNNDLEITAKFFQIVLWRSVDVLHYSEQTAEQRKIMQ